MCGERPSQWTQSLINPLPKKGKQDHKVHKPLKQGLVENHKYKYNIDIYYININSRMKVKMKTSYLKNKLASHVDVVKLNKKNKRG